MKQILQVAPFVMLSPSRFTSYKHTCGLTVSPLPHSLSFPCQSSAPAMATLFATKSIRHTTLKDKGVSPGKIVHKKDTKFVKAGALADDVMSMRSWSSESGKNSAGKNQATSPQSTSVGSGEGEALSASMSSLNISGDQSDTKEILQIVIALLLNSSDRLRGLEATCFYAHIGDKNNQVMVQGIAAHALY